MCFLPTGVSEEFHCHHTANQNLKLICKQTVYFVHKQTYYTEKETNEQRLSLAHGRLIHDKQMIIIQRKKAK